MELRLHLLDGASTEETISNRYQPPRRRTMFELLVLHARDRAPETSMMHEIDVEQDLVELCRAGGLVVLEGLGQQHDELFELVLARCPARSAVRGASGRRVVTPLLELVLSWKSLLVVLLVFGFAPGVVLRLIVHAFPVGDERRDELLAELHVVPWQERPLWVASQLEVALFEGLWGRLVWILTGRIIYRWRLTSGVERNQMYPDTFAIPTMDDKAVIEPGDTVKAMFEMNKPEPWGERMWLEVVKVKRRHIVGRLSNQPVGIPRLCAGDKVKVRFDRIIDIDWYDSAQVCEACAMEPPPTTEGTAADPV